MNHLQKALNDAIHATSALWRTLQQGGDAYRLMILNRQGDELLRITLPLLALAALVIVSFTPAALILMIMIVQGQQPSIVLMREPE